jgi:flagellar biosynthesis protein
MSEHKSPLAVALARAQPGAPRVVAKGRGEVGRRIIDMARAHGVPLEENPALAEALAQVELEHAIPEALYRAVAEVLVFILRMSGRIA